MLGASKAERREYWNRYDWLDGSASFTPVAFRSKRHGTLTRLNIPVFEDEGITTNAIDTTSSGTVLRQAATAAAISAPVQKSIAARDGDAITPKRKPFSEISNNTPNARSGASKSMLLQQAAKVRCVHAPLRRRELLQICPRSLH